MGIISDKKVSDGPVDTRKSAAQNTSIGSGARPTKSSVKIATTDPENAHEMGRAPAGYLK